VVTPTGNKHWNTPSIRTFILEDVYKPHSYEEIGTLVTSDVAARLNPDESYGVWWFNRERVTRRKVAEVSQGGGRNYRQITKTTIRPKAEWIAVPVPHSGIPREVVDAARRAIAHNKPPSSNGDRLWELSNGILRCRDCGFRMRTTTSPKANKTYYYYCSKHHQDWAACPNRKTHRAEDLERQVRDLVYEAMTDPEQLRADLDRMIDVERQGLRQDPKQEAKVWLEKIAEADRMRTGYQEMAAKGLMSFEELGARLEELKKSRDVAVRELEALRGRRERVEQMERDRDALLDSRASMAAGVLEALTPEERHQFYKMGRLEVLTDADGSIEVSGPLVMSPEVCTSGSTP
jgi:site-specific DNA recombinase